MDSSTQELPPGYLEKLELLQSYIKQARFGGLRSKSPDFIEEFAYTYLYCLALLSHIRHKPEWRAYQVPFQNQIIQANLILYPEKTSRLKDIISFLVWDIPARLWKDRWFHLISTSICLVMAGVAFLIVIQDFEMATVFMPPGLRESHQLEAYLFSPEARKAMLTSGVEMNQEIKSVFAVGLAINNIKVAVMCFISGFLFGIPTVLLLIQTGLMLGTLPGLFYPDDLVALGAWLLPHGVPELTAIFLAGGSGMRMGYELLSPSQDAPGSRVSQLFKPLVGTMIICALLLLWAAFVESFIRQSTMPTATRYIIALASLIPIILVFWHARNAYARLQRLRTAI